MNNKRSTKRALLTSVMALVMCVVMLVGTTFAWFTDTASTGVNKIQAGNLKVQLLMRKTDNATGKTYYDDIGDEPEAIFGKEGSLVAKNDNQDTLWEPGKTQVAYLAVRNAGNLALKYNIILNVKDEGLIGALEYAIVPQGKLTGENQKFEGTVASWDAANTSEGAKVGKLAAGTFTAAPNGCLDEIAKDKANIDETDYFALVVHMDENAGNTYMNQSVSIDVKVVATQAAAESDSLGNEYDEQAEYPTIPVKVTTVAEMRKAIEELNENGGKLVLDIGMDVSGYSTVGNLDIKQGELTVNLNGHTLQVAYSGKSGTPAIKVAKGAKVTLEGGTVQSRKGFSMYTIENSGELVLKDVTVKNLAMDTDWNISGEGYFKPVCLRVLDGTVTITGNTNISASRAILVEHKHGNSSTPLPNPQVIIDKGMTGTITGAQEEKCVNANGTDYQYNCSTKNAGFIKDQRH